MHGRCSEKKAHEHTRTLFHISVEYIHGPYVYNVMRAN